MSSEVFGFLNIDKPSGPTSHDIILQLRQIIGIQRIGHTGTLDPLASGVLPICVGKATRLSEYISGTNKRYHAWIFIGQSSITYDSEGEKSSIKDVKGITEPDILEILSEFKGQILQTVPIYSAIKRGGRKLYNLARRGVNITPPKRKVEIYKINLIHWRTPELLLDIHCSSGTYIRSIAHEIGEKLGVGAYLSSLKRISCGSFMICQSISLENLQYDCQWQKHLLPAEWPFQKWEKITLNQELAYSLCQGQKIEFNHIGKAGSLALAMFEDQLIAVVRSVNNSLQPIKVLQSVNLH